MYQIQIIKFEPRSEEEIKLRKERDRDMRLDSRRDHDTEFPNGMSRENFKAVKVLDVELSEEEFKAAKKAIIDTM